jgi:signal transduction histidine kinase
MNDSVTVFEPRAVVAATSSTECGFAWDTMTEVEIVDIPPLKPREQSLLEMHSVLNVLNVLRGELTLIGLELAGDDALLERSLSLCAGLIADLQTPSAALAGARAADANVRFIMAEVEGALDRYPEGQTNPEIKESLEDLASVFNILGVRARELLARAQDPERWVVHSANALRSDFIDVFTAIARNSHGRFRIVFDPMERQPEDYLLTLQIIGACKGGILMPAAFPDSIRDLTANSRKYTAPGGRIAVTLEATTDYLTLQVEDTGRGIAADEIQNVVQFGKRGSNVGDVRTRGGGFGLTKAFLMAKQFGGRFWITSGLGRGTRVRLQIPVSAGAIYGR